MNQQGNDIQFPPEFQPFVSNLNERARQPERMPFIGREAELEAVVETLLRKLKNDLILVGRPGVGKTALITELARRINNGQVPPALRGRTILELSVNSFLYSHGPTETLTRDMERLFAEIGRQREHVILFLDEMQFQTIVAAGKPNPHAHIQGLIKNLIANRELTIIAATTPEDYYKYVKSDEVLAANFSAVMLNEPERDEMLRILAGVQAYFGTSYGLEIPDSLFPQIYEFSQRFIPHRAFPDKAIELLDMSCSKASLKGETQLKADYLYGSISGLSRLAVDIVRRDPRAHYRGLLEFLGERTVNQRSALEEISRILRLSKLDTKADSQRPEGIFLFLGPSGSGKSFVAARIAEYLFGSVEKLRIIDLAGFRKSDDVGKLISSEDGDTPGPLIREVENHPFSVILFENVAEAHSSVLYFLGKVLTMGEIVDPFGKKHHLSRIIFILSLTSIGEERAETTIGFVQNDGAKHEVVIPPKIMNVLDWVDEIIEFVPFAYEDLLQIANQTLERIKSELQNRFECTLQVDLPVVEAICREAESNDRGAHIVKDLLEREIKLKAVDAITRSNQKINLQAVMKDGAILMKSVAG
jgi:ATP-dependent Clp protease ATP-binding subunit ClpC